MNVEEFRNIANQFIDFICQHYEKNGSCDATQKEESSFLEDLIPKNPPMEGENLNETLQDFLKTILPSYFNQHPENKQKFKPIITSLFPLILGDLLNLLQSIGFPNAAFSESKKFEKNVLDWYAKALSLPKDFLGSGVLQSLSCDCGLVCLLTARAKIIKILKGNSSGTHESIYLPQLTAYASKEANASIKRAAKISLIKLRIIETDKKGRMRADLLRQAIHNDIQAGLTPFFVVATIGNANTWLFDDILTIGKICDSFKNIWFHVDGFYGGNLLLLPELKSFASGLEYAESFSVNPNELLLTRSDCSLLWMRNASKMQSFFEDQQSWNQSFSALCMWFIFRTYGITKIQALIRSRYALNKKVMTLLNDLETRNDILLDMVVSKRDIDKK